MAAPDSVTLLNLSGQWVMNRSLSDDFDPLLTLQGVSWFIRKTLQYATVTLNVTETAPTTATTPTSIIIDQILTGGIPGTREERTLDWTDRPHEDNIFGKVQGKSAWVGLEEVEDAWMREGWLGGEGRDGKGYIRALVVSEDRGWTADMVWGFAEMEGKRYYTRRVVVTKGAERKVARLVYDFVKGPNEGA